MEKKVRDFKVNYDLDWMYRAPISKIREDLDRLEEMGATHIEIDYTTTFDCVSVTTEAIAERLETDQECIDRINANKQREDRIKQMELDQLKKLQEKYQTKPNK